MPLFRRNQAPSSAPSTTEQPAPSHPVTDFWRWWRDAGHAVDPRSTSELSDQLTARIAAVHPDLTWHFGPGADAEHRLTVSAGGVAEVRPAAERWLRAAPSAGPGWEFRASQERQPDVVHQVLEIAGQRLDLAQVRVRHEVDDDRLRVHVEVHHPAFGDLPEDAALQVVFLVLDWLLGEDDVERWIGTIEAVTTEPADAADLAALVGVVDRLVAGRDVDQHALARWTAPDGTHGIAMLRPALRWLDRPTHDRHQVVELAYRADPDGLPLDASVLDELNAHEDALLAVLGGGGTLVAHESTGGVRTLHVYTDGEDAGVDERLAAWAGRAGARVSAEDDPGWRQVRHLLG